MSTAPSTASFFLPGLVHQFGNLLLTVQGHALHVDAAGFQRMQQAILGVVQRGSASLQVIRTLMGEQTGACGSAGELFVQVVELGRIPARESGVSLELRGAELEQVVWVPAEPFIMACAEALRRWILCIPAGSSGVVTATIAAEMAVDDPVGLPCGVVVQLGFAAAAGSLPFPIAAQEVVAAMAELLQAANGAGCILPVPSGEQAVMELRFGAERTVTGIG